MKKRLWRIIIGALLFVPALIIKPSDEWIKPALFAVAYLAVGGDVALRAVKNIVHGRVFDENSGGFGGGGFGGNSETIFEEFFGDMFGDFFGTTVSTKRKRRPPCGSRWP